MSSTPHRSSLKVLPQRTPNNLELAYDSFILSLQAAHRTQRTIGYYHEKLLPFVTWLEDHGITDIADITPNHIRTFLLEREQAGLAAITVHHHAATIKAWCNFLVNEELLASSPMRKVKMPKVEQEILPAFSPDEVRRLLAVTKDPRDTAIILCLLDSGCRMSEFLALNVGDIDPKSGAVRIRQGKGRKDRVAFLGTKARKALNKYLMARGPASAEDPLWLLKSPAHELTSDRLTRWALRDVLERLSAKADVANCHPHTFRRTFALWSLRAGMNIYALQQIMGHSDLSMLRRYLALVEEDLEEAHRKHGAVDNML